MSEATSGISYFSEPRILLRSCGLLAEGIDASTLERVEASAGLDLGAITSEEIAMSILAEITVERRRGQRGAGSGS
jgi:xanthine/CO dehydrogenase XdhC/CoxF family maturation factor